MTRRILIVGLIILAAFLPLAPPLASFVLDAPAAVAGVAPLVSPDALPVTSLALAFTRAPPSR